MWPTRGRRCDARRGALSAAPPPTPSATPPSSFRHPSLTPLPPSLPPQDAENDLVVSNKKFKLLGLDPILLESAEGLFTEVKEIAQKYQHRCDRSKVVSKSYWNKARAVAAGAAAEEAAKTKV